LRKEHQKAGDELQEAGEKLHKDEIRVLQSSPDINTVINARRLRLAGGMWYTWERRGIHT
jgi:hypothetical protein